jgi:hypothetical protein
VSPRRRTKPLATSPFPLPPHLEGWLQAMQKRDEARRKARKEGKTIEEIRAAADAAAPNPQVPRKP